MAPKTAQIHNRVCGNLWPLGGPCSGSHALLPLLCSQGECRREVTGGQGMCYISTSVSFQRIPFPLGLEAGGLSPGAEEPPEHMGAPVEHWWWQQSLPRDGSLQSSASCSTVRKEAKNPRADRWWNGGPCCSSSCCGAPQAHFYSDCLG